MENNLENKNIIKSAVKVFHLLEVLIENKRLSISSLSRLTGYTMSTTQRIVNTLYQLDYVDQDQQSFEYYPTLKIFKLGTSVVDNVTIRNISKPYLIELHRKTNETINLGILDGKDVVYIDKIVSNSPLRVELELGVKVPLYCSSLGKAISAYNENKPSFEGEYIKYTKKTIVSDEDLYKDLEEVKKRGYALDDEEYIDGLICIGVPILDLEGRAIASISISTPTIRFEKENIDEYVRMLKEESRKIEKEIYSL